MSGVDNAQPLSPVKALTLLSTLQSADIVLPTIDGREIRLGRITEPDPEQKSLLHQLHSDAYLGAQYRRLRTKLGAPKARKAMANRLARIAYRLLKYGEKYIDKGKEFYEEKYRQAQIRILSKKATKLGFQLGQSA